MSWQKASFCGGGGNNCIELTATPHHIHLRESTAPGVTVSTTPARLQDLLREIKSGRYDHPPRSVQA
ncbi:DUF397 domain-containing protein [Streptantibioticus rubrisoli]|uniref:DUF397 domain-containing protein n=1 Tax=Streptantibioticus rubrisoli TaxID=1387313 RepID=A0ABT1PKM3_9ACTN|nr:DUF397 domain-containing protein [Streptantibioticus rubrisoli]MCQ4045917.1 DUF397 domain-containing protein [Streptantibioticus rubrisoli]